MKLQNLNISKKSIHKTQKSYVIKRKLTQFKRKFSIHFWTTTKLITIRQVDLVVCYYLLPMRNSSRRKSWKTRFSETFLEPPTRSIIFCLIFSSHADLALVYKTIFDFFFSFFFMSSIYSVLSCVCCFFFLLLYFLTFLCFEFYIFWIYFVFESECFDFSYLKLLSVNL